MSLENSTADLSGRAARRRLAQAVNWLNRHSTALALAVLLLQACMWCHFFAVSRIEILRRLWIDPDAGTIRRMAGIAFIDKNWWFILPYFTLFFGGLFWLEIRKAPRWSVWGAFAILAVPCFQYIVACLRLGAFTR